MKIAFCLYEMPHLGGIVGHNEHLTHGLKALGHEVSIFRMQWSRTVAPRGYNDMSGYVVGAFGIKVHMARRWVFPKANWIAYKGGSNVAAAVRRLRRFDVVVWIMPVPTKNKNNRGNLDWLQLMRRVDVPQFAFSHDGNLLKTYPHIAEVVDHLDGLICVHPSSYNAASAIPIPRVMILNPQPPRDREPTPWEQREPGWIAPQTFKGWKHVPELVEAAGYMDPSTRKHVSGEGLDYNYLTSDGKCKYYHGDDSRWPGQKVWDVAVANGMTYRPWVTDVERDEILQEITCLVDPSWSRAYSAQGGHFNRTAVDAVRSGAIPVARPMGMGSELFKPMESYYPVPDGVGPREYAETVDQVCRLTSSEARPILAGGEALLHLFDRDRIAEQFIGFITAGAGGYYGKVECPDRVDPKVKEASDRLMADFFGA